MSQLTNCLHRFRGKDAESVLGESSLAGQLNKQLAERMLAAESSHHPKAETGQASFSRRPASFPTSA